jgi:hypothetical protein
MLVVVAFRDPARTGESPSVGTEKAADAWENRRGKWCVFHACQFSNSAAGTVPLVAHKEAKSRLGFPSPSMLVVVPFRG